jgi:hypothetical protein
MQVASTNLKRLMLILSGAVKTVNLSSISRLMAHEENPMSQLNAFDLTDIIENGLGRFTKIIFVRHPFERLVSAYQSKLVRNDNSSSYYKSVARNIIRKYRLHHQSNPFPLPSGDDVVTFSEYVNFIVDEWKYGSKWMDVHWTPITDLCLPCTMQYDFVGKFETLNEDVEFMLRKLNENNLSWLFTSKRRQPRATLLWQQLMEELSHEQLNDLNSMFADDFRIFGYPLYTTPEV